MATINGIYDLNSKQSDSLLIRKMNRATKHDFKNHSDYKIQFSINSKSNFLEKNGIKVFIYGNVHTVNDVKIGSSTQEEMIFHLYKKFDLNFVNKIHGDFLLIILDNIKKKFILVADPFSNSQIFYTVDGNHLFFSSNLKSLLTANIDKTIDNRSIYEFLFLGYVNPPNTFFSKIKKLATFEILTCDFKGIKLHDYSSNYFNSIPKQKIHNIFEQLKSSIFNKISDKDELSLFLSGGIDSTSLLSMISEVYSKSIFTYTMRSESDIFSNDYKFSDLVAKHFNTNHKLLTASNKSIFNSIPETIWAIENPGFSLNASVVFLLTKNCNEKIVFSGEGADELFCEGNDFRYLNYLKTMRFNHFLSPSRIYLKFNQIFSNKEIKKIMKYKIIKPRFSCDFSKKFDKTTFFDTMNDLSYVKTKSILTNLILPFIKKSSSNFDKESITPYSNTRFVSSILQCPSKYKISLLQSKIILKKYFKDKIPNYVIDRKKSMPISKNFYMIFYLDYEEIIQKEILDLTERQFFNKDLLLKTNKHLDPFKTLQLFGLEIWFKMFLDQDFSKKIKIENLVSD